VFDNGIKVLEIDEFEFAEVFPPVAQLTHHDVVGYQTVLDFGFGIHTALMGP
jgi:hypothetical protein